MIETLIGVQRTPDPRPQVGASLDTILADAYRRADAPIAFVSIDHWDRADAHITIRHFQKDGALTLTTLTYAGATGAFIAEKPNLGTRPSIGGSVFALMGAAAFRQLRRLVVESHLVRARRGERLCHLERAHALGQAPRGAAGLARARPADGLVRRRPAVRDGGFGGRILSHAASRRDAVLDAGGIPDRRRARSPSRVDRARRSHCAAVVLRHRHRPARLARASDRDRWSWLAGCTSRQVNWPSRCWISC